MTASLTRQGKNPYKDHHWHVFKTDSAFHAHAKKERCLMAASATTQAKGWPSETFRNNVELVLFCNFPVWFLYVTCQGLNWLQVVCYLEQCGEVFYSGHFGYTCLGHIGYNYWGHIWYNFLGHIGYNHLGHIWYNYLGHIGYNDLPISSVNR